MLEAIDLRKSYGGRQVLAPISLKLEPGVCLGLAGPNGSGKSTLISLLSQTLRPDGGDIRWNGESVLGRRRFLRHEMGYVPQHNALLDELTGREQLLFWYRCCACRGPLPREVVELLDLEELYSVRVGRMSGGMRKRLSIGMALLTGPRVLLMDEAFAALDAQYRGRLLDWLKGYRKEGGAILWCSHEREELLELCQRVLVLEQGVLQFDGGAGQAGEYLELLWRARTHPQE